MLPDDEIRDFILSHSRQAYDPKKRREYYLRTRELKGRTKGKIEPPKGSRPSAQATGQRARKAFKSEIAKRKADSKARREEAKARIEQLENKLDKLDEIHKKLVAQAKIRSGAKPEEVKDTKTSKTKDSDKGSSKKATAKEKKEAAERAKEAREKEEKTSPQQQIRVLERQIAEARAKIEEARANLKEKKTDKTKDGSKGR